ncbi:MAG: hypothetical protein WC343_02800 [Bacilli bacterium]|jgi:hypothetical protein
MARNLKNQTFVAFVNKKYSQLFKCWDDYALFLYFDYLFENDDKYYAEMEKDLWEYSDMQVGGDKDYGKLETRKNNRTKN